MFTPEGIFSYSHAPSNTNTSYVYLTASMMDWDGTRYAHLLAAVHAHFPDAEVVQARDRYASGSFADADEPDIAVAALVRGSVALVHIPRPYGTEIPYRVAREIEIARDARRTVASIADDCTLYNLSRAVIVGVNPDDPYHQPSLIHPGASPPTLQHAPTVDELSRHLTGNIYLTSPVKTLRSPKYGQMMSVARECFPHAAILPIAEIFPTNDEWGRWWKDTISCSTALVFFPDGDGWIDARRWLEIKRARVLGLPVFLLTRDGVYSPESFAIDRTCSRGAQRWARIRPMKHGS